METVVSWNHATWTWTPDDTDNLYVHLILTSLVNLESVVNWLERINPPWKVYVFCFGDDEVDEIDVVRTVQFAGGMDIQMWSMMRVTPEHRKEIHEAEFSIYDYLDSRLRVPVWMRLESVL